MPRRTKIVATLGPATDAPDVLEQIIRAGVDVVRLNYSHGEAADHQARAQALREAPDASAATWACSPTCRGRRSASTASATGR